jgi:hypothetical protein
LVGLIKIGAGSSNNPLYIGGGGWSNIGMGLGRGCSVNIFLGGAWFNIGMGLGCGGVLNFNCFGVCVAITPCPLIPDWTDIGGSCWVVSLCPLWTDIGGSCWVSSCGRFGIIRPVGISCVCVSMLVLAFVVVSLQFYHQQTQLVLEP